MSSLQSSGTGGPALLPELLLIIADQLGPEDRRNLRLVCRWFEEALGFDIIVAILRSLVKRTVLGGANYSKPRRKSGGYSHVPFVILDVKVDRSVRTIMLHTYKPIFMRPSENVELLDIVIRGDKIELITPSTRNKTDEFWEDRETERDDTIDFFACRKDIALVTAALLRREWECPECRGRRYVCPGCGGFSTR
jgi:hypothetical protein